MTKQDAIEHFGGVRELAEALGIWPNTIYRWDESPPDIMQYKIEVLTQGQLKAERKTAAR